MFEEDVLGLMRILFWLAAAIGVVSVWWVGQRELRRRSLAVQVAEAVRDHLEPLPPAGQLIDAVDIFLRRQREG